MTGKAWCYPSLWIHWILLPRGTRNPSPFIKQPRCHTHKCILRIAKSWNRCSGTGNCMSTLACGRGSSQNPALWHQALSYSLKLYLQIFNLHIYLFASKVIIKKKKRKTDLNSSTDSFLQEDARKIQSVKEYIFNLSRTESISALIPLSLLWIE